MKQFILVILLLALPVFTARAETPGWPVPPVLSLGEALRIARERQPRLIQARAAADAAGFRAEATGAPLLPQVEGSAAYQRGTSNLSSEKWSWDTSNSFSYGLSANQLLWDFGQNIDRWRAARASARAERQGERTTLFQVLLDVHTAFFTARALKALKQVAGETLANQEKHLAQTQGFVKIGSRPEIDLAQARLDLANARLALINAENDYETAKVRLNQAMGVEAPAGYEVADETLPPVDREDQDAETLLAEALKARPEFSALSDRIRAGELTLGSVRGGYGPSLSLSAGYTGAGEKIDSLSRNFSGGVALRWPLFEGKLTLAQAGEARANLASLKSELDTLRQQVRLEVEQARLAIRTAKAAIQAAEDAVVNARKRLDLAEGRYQTGVGNMIELGDAQVALNNAEAQKVQADYNLAAARARLLQALGRF